MCVVIVGGVVPPAAAQEGGFYPGHGPIDGGDLLPGNPPCDRRGGRAGRKARPVCPRMVGPPGIPAPACGRRIAGRLCSCGWRADQAPAAWCARRRRAGRSSVSARSPGRPSAARTQCAAHRRAPHRRLQTDLGLDEDDRIRMLGPDGAGKPIGKRLIVVPGEVDGPASHRGEIVGLQQSRLAARARVPDPVLSPPNAVRPLAPRRRWGSPGVFRAHVTEYAHVDDGHLLGKAGAQQHGLVDQGVFQLYQSLHLVQVSVAHQRAKARSSLVSQHVGEAAQPRGRLRHGRAVVALQVILERLAFDAAPGREVISGKEEGEHRCRPELRDIRGPDHAGKWVSVQVMKDCRARLMHPRGVHAHGLQGPPRGAVSAGKRDHTSWCGSTSSAMSCSAALRTMLST